MTELSGNNLPGPRPVRKLFRYVGIAAFLILLLVIMLFVYNFIKETWRNYELLTKEGNSNQTSATSTAATLLEQRAKIETANSPWGGAAQAKIVLVEFGDFQCPYCLQSFTTVRQLMAKYPDSLKVIWRDFPASQLHPQSVIAAEAARCANEQGKFWEMYDKLFINQKNLAAAALKSYAQQLNLDQAKFATCLDQELFKEKVLADFYEGVNLGVKGTPTFFLNGEKVEGPAPLSYWEQRLKKMLKEVK